VREAIGGISLFQIAIVAVLLFTGVMCLTINHSRAFAVKDEIVTALQNGTVSKTGVANDTITEIIDILKDNNYRVTGSCSSSDGYQGYNLKGDKTNKAAAFCVKAVDVSESFLNDLKDKCKNNKCIITGENSSVFPEMYYYDVIVFYQLNIPGLNQLMNFKMHGSTRILSS